MTNREMETINNIIREKTYCDEEIPGSGSFTYQLYADYRDELDDANIKQIFNSCDPKEEFLDLLMQGYDDVMWEDECEIVSTIMANLEETDVELDEDEIRQYVQENVCIELPEDHYLSQQVNVNIYLDTGDANYDFTLNTFGQCYYGDPENQSMIKQVWSGWLKHKDIQKKICTMLSTAKIRLNPNSFRRFAGSAPISSAASMHWCSV